MAESRRTPWLGERTLVAVLIVLTLVWAYLPALTGLFRRWSDDPQASHGFLVPILAGLILWFRWDYRPKSPPESSWLGVVVLVLAGGMRFLAAYINFDWLDEVSLLVAVTGIVLMVVGPKWTLWASWGIAFLVFMIPLPFLVERAVAGPLQRGATVASTYLLQTFGYPAVAEGNIIIVNQTRLGVLEACNGLGMLQSFIMLSAAMALLSRRSLVERLVLLASGLPIALVANLIRITGTALLTLQTTDPAVHKQIHDIAGWLMIPLALLFLWLVIKLMDNLWLELVLPRQKDRTEKTVARPQPTATPTTSTSAPTLTAN